MESFRPTFTQTKGAPIGQYLKFNCVTDIYATLQNSTVGCWRNKLSINGATHKLLNKRPDLDESEVLVVSAHAIAVRDSQKEPVKWHTRDATDDLYE